MSNGIAMSFAQRVNSFISELQLNNSSLEKQLVKEIVKYYLRISDNTKKQTYVLKTKFASLGLRGEIDRFQNEYLNISYYTLRILFPAIVTKAHGLNKHIPSELLPDISFCLNAINDKELKIFIDNTKDYDTTAYSKFDSFVGGDCWIQNYDKLYGYVRSKVGKLSFLLRDDPSSDIEDYVQEIILGIIKVYNLDPKAFCNKKYVDMAITNQINSILNYHTRGKRKRYYSENDETYEKMKVMKKKKDFENFETLKQSIDKNKATEYYSTLFDSETILNALSFEENYEDKILLSQVFKTAKSKKAINEYCQILLDNNPDFDKWANTANINTNNFTSLCRGAKKYIGSKYKDVIVANWSTYVKNNLNLNYA